LIGRLHGAAMGHVTAGSHAVDADEVFGAGHLLAGWVAVSGRE
jgi:hypothetical protein